VWTKKKSHKIGFFQCYFFCQCVNAQLNLKWKKKFYLLNGEANCNKLIWKKFPFMSSMELKIRLFVLLSKREFELYGSCELIYDDFQ